MDIEFDPDKDAINRVKHGVSLASAAELDNVVVIRDERFAEERFRLYGWIGGIRYCAAVTLRGNAVRIISLRRAHRKEFGRYG